MSVRLSLLAILDQGSCYGYQLGYEFSRRTGSMWPLNVGQIYQTLERLERHGLVAKGTNSEQGHQYYTITEAGREEVAEWMSTPIVRDSAPRDELVIKLALAASLPGVNVADVIHAQRQSVLATLTELSRAKESASDPENASQLAGGLIVDSVMFQAEAELRWLDHVENHLARAADTAVGAKIPLKRDLPKRGRPRTSDDSISAERPSGIPRSLVFLDVDEATSR